MILAKRIALNGNQLDAQDTSIVIRHIDPGVPKESVSAVSLMGGSGQRVTMQHVDTLEVSVTFAIDKPKKRLADRRTVFDKAVKWASQKGWLTVNWMASKRMRVDKVVYPSSGDLWNWTDDYTIVFRAYGVPFWQDDTATTVTDTLSASTAKTKTLTAPGTAPTVADVEFKNTSGSACTTFAVEIGGKTMELTGLALAQNESLIISHGTDGILRITEGGRNAYGKQTGGGLEDLYIQPGDNSIKVTAATAGNLTLSCYGRYM